MSEETNENISATYLKKADDFNTQILTSIGTYISLITSDDLPNKKQIKKLISSIEKPIDELVKLCEKPHFSTEIHEKIKELDKYKLEITQTLEKKEPSHDATDKVVTLYHHTSDIDNLLFDLLYSD